MKKRKHPHAQGGDTWMGFPQKGQKTFTDLVNEILTAPYAMDYDPILDDPEALTEYIKKKFVRKVPIDATPTHDVSFMKREQMDGFAQFANWLQDSRNIPNYSAKRREQLISLYREMFHDLQKAICYMINICNVILVKSVCARILTRCPKNLIPRHFIIPKAFCGKRQNLLFPPIFPHTLRLIEFN